MQSLQGRAETKTLLKITNWSSVNLFEKMFALLRVQYGCARYRNIWYFKLCLIYTSLLQNQEFSFKYIIITCCFCNLYFNVVRYCCVLICMGRLRNQELRFEYIISLHDVCKTHLIFHYAFMHQHRIKKSSSGRAHLGGCARWSLTRSHVTSHACQFVVTRDDTIMIL